jgi:hypothetical protein
VGVIVLMAVIYRGRHTVSLKYHILQVGVIVLIGLYMVIGAFIFRHLEADSQMGVAVTAYQAT